MSDVGKLMAEWMVEDLMEVARLEAENVALRARVAALTDAHARYRHMDRAICDVRAWGDDFRAGILRDLWLVIKGAVESPRAVVAVDPAVGRVTK